MKIRQRIIKEVQHIPQHQGSCFDWRARWITATCHWIHVCIWPPMWWCCNTLLLLVACLTPHRSRRSVRAVQKSRCSLCY